MATDTKTFTTLTINLPDRARFKMIKDKHAEELGTQLKIIPEFSIASFFDLILGFIESKQSEFLDYCFEDKKV